MKISYAIAQLLLTQQHLYGGKERIVENKRKKWFYIFRWSFVLLISGLIISQIASSRVEAKAAKAPDFSLSNVNGGTTKLSSLRGKVVLVNFWATWCPPCRAEIPALVTAYERFKGKGFVILGVAIDNIKTPADQKNLSNFVKRARITYPILVGNSTVTRDYGSIFAVPTSFLIDGNGEIVRKYVGFLEGKKLEADLLPLLKR